MEMKEFTVAVLTLSAAVMHAAVPGLHAEFRSIDSANIGLAVDGVFAPTSFKTTFAEGTLLEEKTLAPTGGLAFDDTNALPSSDNWAGLVTGTIDLPSSGRYTLSATFGGAFYLALDGRPVMQSKHSQPCATAVFLEEGPHAIEIGLAKTTGSSSLTLSAHAPGAGSSSVIPLAWLSYDNTDPGGATAPITVVAANGDTIYVSAGTTVVTAHDATLDSLGLNAGADAELYGTASAGGLYGSGALSVGSCLYTKAVMSDADTGLDPAKTYTHLVSFPRSGGSAMTPEVNGVTFDGRGTCSVARLGGNAFTDNKSSGDFPGYMSICQSSQYKCSDFLITLAGLTPGAVYDFRYYWRSRNENPPRNATFVFYGQDMHGNAVTNQIGTFALETLFGTGGEKYGIIGCRYRAGADGKANLRVISADTSSVYKAAFLYAISNELLADSMSGSTSALQLVPAAGGRASFYGTIFGGGAVTVSGTGEQLLGGVVALAAPVSVVSGRLVLANGANVSRGVDISPAATVELRGGAHLGGLVGTGTLDFKYGDSRLFGDVYASGDLSSIPNFRICHFTNDVSSGISPSKTYFVAHDYQTAPDIASPVVVNEVPFRPTAATGYDTRTVYAYVSGTPVNATSGSETNIRMAPTETLYSILSAMRYPNWRTAPNTNNYKIDNLLPGKTYEVRFYERNWGSSANRTTKFTFTPSGKSEAEEHTVALDTEGASGPYYVAIRFTATSSSYAITAYSPNSDGWSLYGATVELVESGITDRAFLDVAEYATFAGAVKGGGSVQKNGKGTLTFSGAVDSEGFWYVDAGGLLLANANASVGEVAASRLAANKAIFGGVGNVKGNVGIPGAATLVLGIPGVDGTLAVGGKVALGEGATVVVNSAASCVASELVLPSDLSIKPTLPLRDRVTIFESAAPMDSLDVSGWTIYAPDGVSVTSRMMISVSEDRRKVTLSPSGMTIIIR